MKKISPDFPSDILQLLCLKYVIHWGSWKQHVGCLQTEAAAAGSLLTAPLNKRLQTDRAVVGHLRENQRTFWENSLQLLGTLPCYLVNKSASLLKSYLTQKQCDVTPTLLKNVVKLVTSLLVVMLLPSTGFFWLFDIQAETCCRQCMCSNSGETTGWSLTKSSITSWQPALSLTVPSAFIKLPAAGPSVWVLTEMLGA